MSIVSHFVLAKSNIEQPGFMGPRMVVYLSSSYLVLVVVLISLGVGSIMARRWARALTLVLSYYALICGLAASLMMVFVLPRTYQQFQALPDASPGAMTFALVLLAVVLFVMYIALPSAFILFYRSPHVKATCAQRNPSESWTDRSPLPVLGASIGLFAFSLCGLFSILFIQFYPLFGFPIRGAMAVIIMLALCSTTAYLTYAIYKRRMSAWRLSLILTAVVTLSTSISFLRINLLDEYARIGFSDAELEAIISTGFVSQPVLTIMVIVPASLWAIYLFAIRKYFVDGNDSPKTV